MKKTGFALILISLILFFFSSSGMTGNVIGEQIVIVNFIRLFSLSIFCIGLIMFITKKK